MSDPVPNWMKRFRRSVNDLLEESYEEHAKIKKEASRWETAYYVLEKQNREYRNENTQLSLELDKYQKAYRDLAKDSSSTG